MKMVIIYYGSSTDIVFKTTLKHMKLGELRPTLIQTPIFGFTGERVMTEGTTGLLVSFGNPGDIEVVHMVPFLVIDQLSNYNVIIGRAILKRLRQSCPLIIYW